MESLQCKILVLFCSPNSHKTTLSYKEWNDEPKSLFTEGSSYGENNLATSAIDPQNDLGLLLRPFELSLLPGLVADTLPRTKHKRKGQAGDSEELIAGVLRGNTIRGNTIRGNTTRNSERKMAL